MKNAEALEVIDQLRAGKNVHRRAVADLGKAAHWIRFGNTSYAWSYVMRAGDYLSPAANAAIAAVWTD